MVCLRFRLGGTEIPLICWRKTVVVMLVSRSTHFVFASNWPPMRIQKWEIKNQKKNENANLSLHIGWKILIFFAICQCLRDGDDDCDDDTNQKNCSPEKNTIRTHSMCLKYFFSLLSWYHVGSCRHMDRKRCEETSKFDAKRIRRTKWMTLMTRNDRLIRNLSKNYFPLLSQRKLLFGLDFFFETILSTNRWICNERCDKLASNLDELFSFEIFEIFDSAARAKE